jgi:hypothetical protein
MFKVYWKGEWPKKKRIFHPGEFENRQQARQWCRNHLYYEGLTIVHPDGREEPWEKDMNREARLVERIVASTMHMAFNPMRGLHLDRGFYVPKDAEIEQITPEGTDLDIRAYEKNGVLFAVAFAGKANRPLWNYRFRDRNQLDKMVEDTASKRRGHMEWKQKRQDERSQFSHTLKEGDILYSSWGYDQTNINYYQVIEVGQKSVKIREIGQKVVGGSAGSDSVVASPGHFIGPAQTKIVRPGNSLRLTSYSSAYPWDGRPLHQTAFGYGH